MPRFHLLTVFTLLMSLAMVGCGGDDAGEPTASDPASSDPVLPGTDASGTPGTPAVDEHAGHSHTDSPNGASGLPMPKGPAWPERETLDGTWVVRLPQMVPPSQENPQPMIGEAPALIVKLTPGNDDEPGNVETIVGRMIFENLSVTSSSVQEKTVQFSCAGPDGRPQMTFEGLFRHGVVGGAVTLRDGNVWFVRLVPCAERTFARMPTFAQLPMAEVEQFNQLAQSPVPEEDTKEFAKNFPSSPLITIGQKMGITEACQAGIDTEKLNSLVKQYADQQANWGERSALLGEVDAIQLVVSMGREPEWCVERLDVVQEKLKGDESLAAVSKHCGNLRKQARYNLANTRLTSDDEAERAEGIEIAGEFLKERPHDPILVVGLADAARRDGRKEDAIQLYAELAALPMQERQLENMWRGSKVERILPSKRLATLWAEVHGSSDGMDEFIQETYDNKLVSYPVVPEEPRADEPGNRTALLELFTGVQCPLSVASESALAGLSRKLPTTTLVTLRYHVHMAGPNIGHDPLTNEDNEVRYFNFYGTNLTPRIFLDGVNVQGVEGGMVDSERVYKDLGTLVNQVLELKSDVSIDLKAIQQDGMIQLSCTATGTEEVAIPETARLRLVLAESGVNYLAANGIRRHDMIARKVLGGDAAPVDGKLEWQGSISIEDVRTELHDYLKQYEANLGHEFASTPLELNNLSVVAIVQEPSRKVLQSRVVNVE